MVVQPSSHIWILWKEMGSGWGNFYGDWSVLRTSQTKVIRGPHASCMLPEPLWRTEPTLLVQSRVWSCEPSGPYPSPQRRVTCGLRGPWQWALNWWLMFNFAEAQRTTHVLPLSNSWKTQKKGSRILPLRSDGAQALTMCFPWWPISSHCDSHTACLEFFHHMDMLWVFQ